ncbi:MAG TPA: ADOP family duplicated permease [Gemmatimonadaceae bacterium]|nr:ADOP family duplicated permease [Gemmatimonadaceae bacterium]
MSRGREAHGIRAGVRRLFKLPLFTRMAARADADAELDAFLAERVERLMRAGMSPADARAEALRRLGSPESDVRRELRRSAERRERHQWMRQGADDLREDLRLAMRRFATSPAFTAAAVLTLALGIGANTAIFSAVHRLLLSPLDYPNGDRMVMPMQENDRFRGDSRFERRPVGGSLIDAWQQRTHTVEEIAAASEDMFSVDSSGTVDTLTSAVITVNFLPMLGVQPVVGRAFTAQDVVPKGPPNVALISAALWQHGYAGRPDIVGRTVSLDGRPLTIVGVTPAGLNIPLSGKTPPDMWVPDDLGSASNGGSGSLDMGPAVFALLRRGVTLDAASRELQDIAASMPHEGGLGGRLRVMRAQDFVNAPATRSLHILFAAVDALLLIACATVANLLLARAWTRQREFAIRGALGAGRRRLARQVLTESLSLALAGGALGAGVAWLALRIIVALRPPALDRLANAHIEPAVLLWTLGVSVLTGLLFGSAPAFFAGLNPVGDVLRRETRGGSASIASRRVRSSLVVLQIAASLTLLVASGLLVRSFAALQRMPLGFEPRGLDYADILIAATREQRLAIRDEVVRHLAALHGVRGVAIGVMPGKGWAGDGLETEADRAGHVTSVPVLGTVMITPDYFRVAGIALVAGRLPDSSPPPIRRGSWSPEVLVNRALARRLWPDGHALGSLVRPIAFPGQPLAQWSTVVGVVDDTRMPGEIGDVAALQVYTGYPYAGEVPLVVRTGLSGDAAAPMIKRAIMAVDPHIFVRPILSGDTFLRDSLAPTRFATSLLTAFAVVALVLAALGLSGVIAYTVSQRMREIGIRLALGADPRTVVTRVVAGGLRLVALGLVLGTAAAVAATRCLASMLYGVGAADPLTFVVIAALVALIALPASYLPARRALRIDPAQTLRAD